MEYERLHPSEDPHDDFRYRQRTLQRWRLSMLMSFAVGVMVTMIVYPRVQPCADVRSVANAAASRCPTCPSCPVVDTKKIVTDAVSSAVTSCPKCPACPSCPTTPSTACPACELKCPDPPSPVVAGGSCPPAKSDSDAATAHRSAMLARPLKNIIECKPGQVCRTSADARHKVIGQKGVVMWYTGLSGSGKTTITEALEKKLIYGMGKNVYRIDGDNLRTGLTRDLGFSAEDRAESVRRASEVAQLFAEAGVITMVTLISPYRKDRDAARASTEKKGIPFLEVYMDVPLDVVKARDPKGLYKLVAAGKIKNFTGIDAPYEAPLSPEVTVKNHEMGIEKCVDVLVQSLEKRGFLTGFKSEPGLQPPDGGEYVDLHVTPEELPAKMAEAATLPQVPLTDVDTNWLQVIGEGWAAPLKGFMREGILVQSLHFNSILTDEGNITGLKGVGGLEGKTEWMTSTFPRDRVSMPIPIVLPITDFSKRQIGKAAAVSLVNAAGTPLAILRNPEIYEMRAREIISRAWGIIDDEHPYLKEVYLQPGKNWCLGGEVELLGRIKYGDGLDQYRLTVDELRAAFKKKGADVVYAFQTRNPTHAGHAFLMKDSRKRLQAKGYANPVLWLSPLGGWTKKSDVPLDVRVKQHVEVMAAGELHPDWTVMAIWPSPMVYSGPTEVQFHAKSRRVAGASFFTVGRDPAGMPYSSGPNEGDDLYQPDHGRFVLIASPGSGNMEFLGFSKVYYDKQTHTMRDRDDSRKDDFISISGSKMRKLAALAAKPCPSQIPSDLIAAKCIPPGFMVQKGWEVVSDYYIRQKTGDWIPYSKQLGGLTVAPGVLTTAEQPFGKLNFKATFTKDGVTPISPWHDLPLYPDPAKPTVVNFVCEIPKGSTAKLEVQKKVAHNPIMQDQKKGKLRYYTYGSMFVNYGMLPQTWEDPAKTGFNGTKGDNDPLDVMEVGSKPFKVGEMRPVKVIGDLELIDQGELDHKILVIDVTDPLADKITTAADLLKVMPGVTEKLVEWLKMYKTTDGKDVNVLASDVPKDAAAASAVVAECHESWKGLKATPSKGDAGFWLG